MTIRHCTGIPQGRRGGKIYGGRGDFRGLRRRSKERGRERNFWTGCTGLTGWERTRVPISWGELNAEVRRRENLRGARRLSKVAVQGEGAALGTGVVAELAAGDGERIGGMKPVATTAAWNWCSTTLESAGMGFGSMG